MCVCLCVIEEMEIKEKSLCGRRGRARKKTIKLFICRSQSEIREILFILCGGLEAKVFYAPLKWNFRKKKNAIQVLLRWWKIKTFSSYHFVDTFRVNKSNITSISRVFSTCVKATICEHYLAHFLTSCIYYNTFLVLNLQTVNI